MGQEEDYSMFEAFIVALASVWADSGFSALTSGNVIMIGVGLVLLYLAMMMVKSEHPFWMRRWVEPPIF